MPRASLQHRQGAKLNGKPVTAPSPVGRPFFLPHPLSGHTVASSWPSSPSQAWYHALGLLINMLVSQAWHAVMSECYPDFIAKEMELQTGSHGGGMWPLVSQGVETSQQGSVWTWSTRIRPSAEPPKFPTFSSFVHSHLPPTPHSKAYLSSSFCHSPALETVAERNLCHEEQSLWVQGDLGRSPSSAFPSCMTLDKVLNLLKPRFPHLPVGLLIVTPLEGCC